MGIKGFAERLSESRQNGMMTQEELAASIGVTPQAVSKWERGISLPDTGLLQSICQILDVSADELLETGCCQRDKNSSIMQQAEVLRKLEIAEPLRLLLGVHIVEAFQKSFYPKKYHEIRLSLAKKGILMPAIRVMDETWVQPDSFVIQAYQKVLYSEQLAGQKDVASYIGKRIEETVGDLHNYAYILNRELVKLIVERARQFYPILLESVPERISYGYLQRIFKGLLIRGKDIRNINKIVEVVEENMDRDLSMDQMVEKVLEVEL